MADLVGKVFERKYRLVRLLGEGGMGAVYEAEHTILNRTVAVKVMHPVIATNPIAVDRFFREAQAASAIGHPNIIEIFDVGKDDDGEVFMVMELLRGESLEALLDKRGRLPAPRTIEIILQVLSALHAAHHKGIIHRDLKADNVFLAVDARLREEVKILDFGIAKVQGSDFDTDMGLTKTGTVLGTPHYLSPEQARGGKNIDHRIDIWTVGVLMYEMLTGEMPFEGENYNEILSKVLLDEPTPINELVPEVPKGLVAVVEKALTKDRDERYVTVSEMIEDLMKLNDRATEGMSTSVVKALKSSVIPPPYVPESEDEVQPSIIDSQPTVEMRPSRVVSSTPITTEPKKASIETLSPDLVDTYHSLVPEPDEKESSKKVIVGVGVGIAALLALVLAITAGNTDETSSVKADTPGNDEPSQTTASAEKSASPSNTDIRRPHKKSGRNEKAKDENAVTLTLVGVPDGARITIDKKPVEPPITLRKSTKRQMLRVAARGFRPFEGAIIPDRNRTLKVVMKKIAATSKQAPSTRQKQPKNPYGSQKGSSPKTLKDKTKQKKKGKKVWADNPFGN